MNRRNFLKMTGLGVAGMSIAGWGRTAESREKLPNIVYILCDDLGYGDVKCLNPEGKIATSNVDKLAAGGMIFTDAHSGSSVCTPTRYGVMTGRYSWRTRLQTGVLGGYSSRLIAPGRMTVASFLKENGYATACFGKWHLGMDWARTSDEPLPDAIKNASNVDFSKPAEGGPADCGFDYYFGISASLDMPPYVFIENKKAVSIPAEITKEGGREGLTAKDFKAVDVLPALTRKTVEYIEKNSARSKEGKPFFIYMPLNSPHTPIVPTAEWQGKSGLGKYGDFVMETDAFVGRILEAVQKSGAADNTLVIFTSDNGCAPYIGVKDLEAQGHFPSGPLRGYKASAWEGGHRLPFIVRWPGVVKPGTVCPQLIQQGDLIATLAQMFRVKLPDNAGEDSVGILPLGFRDSAYPNDKP